MKRGKSNEKKTSPQLKTKVPPTHWNWKDKGAVTEVKNQGVFGFGWAHAVTASVECAVFNHTNELIALSDEDLIDSCAKLFGCNGGKISSALEVVQSKGMVPESDLMEQRNVSDFILLFYF